MAQKNRHKLTLYEPATYQIKVPGLLDERRSDWNDTMTVRIEYDAHGRPITNLTGSVDQAALQGILRRLYSLGFPLISVICVPIE